VLAVVVAEVDNLQRVNPTERLRAIATGIPRIELLRQYSTEDLARGLREEEDVVYRENGNRAVPAARLLKALQPALRRIGVSRIGDISALATSRFPVFQSARPGVLYHTEIGQNSGAQGKGVRDTQARLSCSMETIEGYCCEPREANVIRGSYAFLKQQHVVLDPRPLVHCYDIAPATADEPLAWTPAYSMALDREILIPAQVVYFPFLAQSYRTRSVFPCNSNGLASGATYLEAATHALYELIERFYTAAMESGEARIEAIYEEELTGLGISKLRKKLGGEFELQVYATKIPRLGKQNLPMITCLLVGDTEAHPGSGCSSDVDVSISRAVSEALQAAAVMFSGTREDMDHDRYKKRRQRLPPSKLEYPLFRSLRYVDYVRQVHHVEYDDLRSEFRFLVSWLKRVGYPEICFANLTRAGVEVPVVKALVPGLPMENELRTAGGWTIEEVMATRWRG
jgi:ribosomal protein S12 methylthiotransferase accessory factor